MDLNARLAGLARISRAPTPVVSVYLNTRWADEHQRDRARVFLKNEVGTAGDRAAASDLRWIEEQSESVIAQTRFADAHGVALFACEAIGLREILPVRVPFEDTFVVADAPFLRPLAGALEAAPPALVVFVDSESARLIPADPSGAGEEVALESEVPGHHRRGGWAQLAQSRYQRHIQDHRGRHFEAATEALVHLVEQHRIERIVLAGEARNVAAFRKHLPHRIAEQVAGVIPGARHESAAAFLGRAGELLARVEEREETDAIESALTEAAKGGRAVSGLEATLEAASRGAVHRLYLLKRFSEPGRGCVACGALQPGDSPRCRLCAGETEPVELGSAMADRVIAAGGRVETIERHEELARLGGVVARLRYPL